MTLNFLIRLLLVKCSFWVWLCSVSSGNWAWLGMFNFVFIMGKDWVYWRLVFKSVFILRRRLGIIKAVFNTVFTLRVCVHFIVHTRYKDQFRIGYVFFFSCSSYEKREKNNVP